MQTKTKDGHKHEWRIFKDPNLNNSGFLSFFCTGCLELRKVKKEYSEKTYGLD